MKLIANDMATSTVAGFQFSAVRPEALGAPEYTLVTLVVDKTGSVAPFAAELTSVKRAVVDACRKSPRSEYLLLRLVEFNMGVDEVHGFLPLSEIDTAKYETPRCHGMTALHDAAFSAVSATNAYGKSLADQDYLVNGIVFIVTDGDDNGSRTSAQDVAAELAKGRTSEALESIRTVLIGVNASAASQELKAFRANASIDQYEEVADATPARLARLADFVSRSISAQSQSLGTGGPSQALTF